VEINFDRRRPEALLDLTRVRELAGWDTAGGGLRVGAGGTYTRLNEGRGGRLPCLAHACRWVCAPQIGTRGTAGGNRGAASPAGDGHPPLLACGAEVEAESAARGVRMIPAADFFTGAKRNALEPDELIRAFWAAPASGPQYFS